MKAIAVLREGAGAGEDDLIARSRARMAGFQGPRSIEIRDGLPRTATGEVQRFLSRGPYWEGSAGS